MYFWETFRSSRSGMDMVTAEEFSKFEGIGDRQLRKVLVAEGDNLPLSHEARELRFSSVRKGAQLDAADLGSSAGRKMRDFDTVSEELGVVWIGFNTVIRVSEGLQRRILLFRIPCRQIVLVL
jgi:hypothetical protein